MSGIDLDAYFGRIGYGGPVRPMLDVLRALHLLHPQAIAFESLDPYLGRPVSLDVAALQCKLIAGRRGGYCFEHNLIFWEVLRAIGFSATGLAARVLWNQPPDAMTARGHMLLRVEIDGETWVADVGFGGVTMTAPILLQPGVEQATPHEKFRLMEIGGYFHMEVDIDDAWRTLYRFDLQEHFPIDYAVTSYYLSTNPASHFTSNVIAARALPHGRLALLGNQLTRRGNDGTSERIEIADENQLAATLQSDFGIIPPDLDAFLSKARKTVFEVKS